MSTNNSDTGNNTNNRTSATPKNKAVPNTTASLENPIRKKRVIVGGMGPAGMMAALKAKEKGYEVIIFEKRDHFTLMQRTKLGSQQVAWLKEYSDNSEEDKKFFDELDRTEDRTIEIANLQKYLERKLISKGIKICKGVNHEIVEFNLNEGKNLLHVRSNDKEIQRLYENQNKENITEGDLAFDYFVAADGAKRIMAEKLNKAVSKTNAETEKLNEQNDPLKNKKEPLKEITYHELEEQTRQTTHATIFLRSKTLEPVGIFMQPVSFKNIQSKFQALGWNEPFPPNCYMFRNADSTHFFVAGEIPETIDAIESPQEKAKMLEKWALLVMELQYGVTKRKIEGQPDTLTEEKLELDIPNEADVKAGLVKENPWTTFPVLLKYTDTPHVKLNQNAHYISIGDATMNANFFLGHGANDALTDAVNFSKSLPNENDPQTEFNSKLFIDAKKTRREDLTNIMLKKAYERRIRDKEYIPEIRNEMVQYANYLATLAKPLLNYDKSIAPQYHEFSNMMEQLNHDQRSFDYDTFYQKVLEFSTAINNSLDHFTQQKAHEASMRVQKELAATRNKLFEVNKKIMKQTSSKLSDRSKAWLKERESLSSEVKKLEDQLEFQKKYNERMQSSELKKKTEEMLKKHPQLLHGYIQRLKEPIHKGKRPTPDKPHKNKGPKSS